MTMLTLSTISAHRPEQRHRWIASVSSPWPVSTSCFQATCAKMQAMTFGWCEMGMVLDSMTARKSMEKMNRQV